MKEAQHQRYTKGALDDLKLMTFRLAPVDVEILDAFREKLGLVSRAEALRYAMRRAAETEGVDVKAAKTRVKRRKATP